MDALRAGFRAPARAAALQLLAAGRSGEYYRGRNDLAAAGAAFLGALQAQLPRPNEIIGGATRPYLRRWHLVPRTPELNVYLHQFQRDDDPRALHDHPWTSVSITLDGGYREVLPDGVQEVQPGDVVFRAATHRHRIELIEGREAWTLFITGAATRSWGFWCPEGFVHWRRFTNPHDSGRTGRGCA